jgi:methylglutaconyl-CoA hydratase
MAVRQQVTGRVLTVTIDNPGTKNAFDQATMAELRDLFENIAYREPLPPKPAEDLDVGTQGTFRPHVIVLRSSGDIFCAGAHLGEMKASGEADLEQNLAASLEMGAMFRAVRNCPAPVVARVQGPAYGGGVGLVAACDVVVAGMDAKFAFSEVRLGLVPGVISPLVVGRIGAAAARRLFLTGETVEIDEALRLGLVDRIAASGRLDAEVETVAREILKGGPAALGRVKSLVEGVISLGFDRSADFSARAIAEARAQVEGQKALEAFLDRKPAPWTGGDDWPGLPPFEEDA